MDITTINQRLNSKNINCTNLTQSKPFWKTRADFQCMSCKGIWTTDLYGSLYHGRGCPFCALKQKIKRITKNKLSQLEIDTRVDTLQLPVRRVGDYENMTTKILWQCVSCDNVWNKTPSDIIFSRHGCPKCSKRERVTNEVIDNRIKNGSYNLIRVENSMGSMVPINWKCVACDGIWKARPNDVFSIHKSGCPYCSKKPFSKLSISWLTRVEQHNNIIIQHAGNGNEFTIPGTRYKADGFCKSTNTIYEFHGNRFHGNPRMFDPSDTCHPYDPNITAGELLKRTLCKENKIRKLGYNLVVMWEDEFIKNIF